MLEIIKAHQEEDVTIPMSEMLPLQVAVICDPECNYQDNRTYVMRTASKTTFEVMSLTRLNMGHYWGIESIIKVRLLRKGEEIVVRLFNE